MINNNKKLEQISKQVGLLNRLIELLRMQEEPPDREHFHLFGWKFHTSVENEESGYIATFMHPQQKTYVVLDKVWNHPLTQKAWSDELVKVAKGLNDLDPRIKMTLFPVLEVLEIRGIQPEDPLEAILNKYGRSLNE